MPRTGRPRSKSAGRLFGTPSSKMLAGPPERMIPGAFLPPVRRGGCHGAGSRSRRGFHGRAERSVGCTESRSRGWQSWVGFFQGLPDLGRDEFHGLSQEYSDGHFFEIAVVPGEVVFVDQVLDVVVTVPKGRYLSPTERASLKVTWPRRRLLTPGFSPRSGISVMAAPSDLPSPA